VQVAKALIQNHINPNPGYAQAGRSYANMRLQAMANEINRQANAAKAETSWEEDAAAMTDQFAAVA
jgi:hypothetical protein